MKKSTAQTIRLPKKSFWKDRTQRNWSFYCGLCGIPRMIPYQPKPGLKHMAQIALTSIVFMIATWSWFGFKGIVSFVPFWAIFEFIYRAKVRGAIICKECGFDPVAFHIDLPRARTLVDQHWRKKFADKGIPYPEKTQQKGKLNAAQSKAASAPPTASTPPPEMRT